MHCVGKTVTELHALLIDFEKGLKDKAPTPQVFTIQKGRDNKPKPQANKKVTGKGKADKNKQVVPYQPNPKPNPLKRKENPNKDQACHHCHVAGHWKRNCPLYIEELRANKKKSEPGAAVSVRSKWIFKKKTDMDGKVHTYKARLVAKGCTQTYGVDYEKTFSPVADIRAIRILIATAAYYDYEIWQMDVKTAFLNGCLDEDIYMEQPEGYVNPKYPNRVCKLQRSIYGLKQASRQWNKRFDEEIKKFGFTQNRDEPCVYRKASGSNVVFLILYVDDILIMGNNIPRLKEVKDYLGKCFSMKDLGEAAYILGIKIYRDRSKRLIGLSQSAYIDKILKKFNMHNSKKGYLPMEVKHELSNEMCASTPEEVAYMKKVPYASAVGSIMYAVRCTRPDVAFAQNLVSRYQQNPGKLHWVAVKHILKYLRNTRDMFLVYGGKPDTELNVTGFCDASWQCDKDDTKSQTGYVFVVNGGAVDWKSKKQTTIAMSATQAEYMAASEAAMEAVWIRKFVGDLGVMPSIKEPINMYCDNSAAIIFANDSGVMKGARHFLRRYHYVREQVESGEIKILKVHTDDNLADPFTKALPRGKVTDHANGIGLQLASSFMHTYSIFLTCVAFSPKAFEPDEVVLEHAWWRLSPRVLGHDALKPDDLGVWWHWSLLALKSNCLRFGFVKRFTHTRLLMFFVMYPEGVHVHVSGVVSVVNGVLPSLGCQSGVVGLFSLSPGIMSLGLVEVLGEERISGGGNAYFKFSDVGKMTRLVVFGFPMAEYPKKRFSSVGRLKIVVIFGVSGENECFPVFGKSEKGGYLYRIAWMAPCLRMLRIQEGVKDNQSFGFLRSVRTPRILVERRSQPSGYLDTLVFGGACHGKVLPTQRVLVP
ncbi:retrotransposon protein, putative, ty1-copia subclass [Tanacetum coccineum]